MSSACCVSPVHCSAADRDAAGRRSLTPAACVAVREWEGGGSQETTWGDPITGWDPVRGAATTIAPAGVAVDMPDEEELPMTQVASDRPSNGSLGRRGLFKVAAFAAGAAALAPLVGKAQEGRDYGPDAPPVHYPDPDIVSLDPRLQEPGQLGDPAPLDRRALARGSGLERPGPLLALERHPQQHPAALARGRRPRQRLPQSVGQQQRQHLRLAGPPDLLPARQPPRGALRARRLDHRAGRHSSRASRSTRRTTPSSTRTAASGSPIRPTAPPPSAGTRGTPASSTTRTRSTASTRPAESTASPTSSSRRTASASRTTTRSSTSSTPAPARAISGSLTSSTRRA